MIWFYRLFFLPALLLALPYYLLRMWRRGGYRKSFSHRFGCLPRLPPPADGKLRIWLQAVSVGEVLAIGPLLEELQKRGTIEIVLTTTTSTGYAEARKRYLDRVLCCAVFPLDFWPFSRAAWKRLRPDALILTESELWPEHLHQAGRRQVPAFLVNARISDRSYARYRKLGRLPLRLFSRLDHLYAATELDRERLLSLGADDFRVTCSGSIKFDVPLPDLLDDAARAALRAELGFGPSDNEDRFVLMGSSTWPGEEALLIEIQRELLECGVDCRLLLVPRHAERGAEIRRLLERQNLSWHQRSAGAKAPPDIRIHLADTTGELPRLTQAADLAFVGKSMPPNAGGQTPIEAAGLGIPVVIGPNMTNFQSVARSLVRREAAIQVADPPGLGEAVRRLADAPDLRRAMGAAGREWHRRNRGSSARIANGILTHLFPGDAA